MRNKPIPDFENDYCLTDDGMVVDLQTGKFKKYYFRGNDTKPRVDLYKNGRLEISIYVEDLICETLFGKIAKGYYKLKFKDGDKTNLSLNNIEIYANDLYETKVQIKKPKKIYHLTIDGPAVINQNEIDEVIELNTNNSLEKEKMRRNRTKKIPHKDTPEYELYKLTLLERGYVKYKICELNKVSLKNNVNCTLTYEIIRNKLISINYCCELTNTPLTFEKKKNNTITIKAIGKKDEDITIDNIIITAKRPFS